MIDECHKFETPVKKVKTQDDLKVWEKSETYMDYLRFIQAVGDSIVNKKITDILPDAQSKPVTQLLDILENLSVQVDEIKPLEQEQRFGNKAYRDWHAKMCDTSENLIQSLLPEKLPKSAGIEISKYFQDGFGNSTRIDYGTGHEMAFLFFLNGLFKVGALEKDDIQAVGLKVFGSYMNLVRKLQLTYRMEPAGSQGVWALDDYQFVAFIWGAAQFINHPRFRPKSIPDYDMAEALAKDYHLSACIKYISQVKTGPFPEHSNQLWNISAVATWEKVNSGLIKMYRAEVLSKFPVIQHVLFGSIFTLKESANPLPEVPIANTRGGTGPRPGASTLPGTIPPMGVMPPRPSGAMPPMGVMPPRASGEMLPMGAKPPKVSGTMSPMGVMPPRALGTMPPLGAMPPMGVLPPKSTLITEDSTSNSCTAKVTAEMK